MKTLEALLSLNYTYVLIALFTVFFTLEQVLSNQFRFTGRTKHLGHNVLFMVLLFAINIFWASVIVLAVDWLHSNKIGLFHLLELPFWVALIAGLMLYDMTAYWFHRMAHRISLVWRFHRVHHSDTSLDSSSNFRGHPIETLFWFGASDMVATTVFGLHPMALGLYALILIPVLIIEHTNLRFPTWLDRTVGLVITTPNFHKIHHDRDQQYTDSNYADIFILWDRLFGTFKYKPADQINFGLDEFDAPEKQTFWYLIRSPFMTIERKTSGK
jgi:sterol desaturase/sphingolipid hydroxylase (fatty acid hydroxylase superfamily)